MDKNPLYNYIYYISLVPKPKYHIKNIMYEWKWYYWLTVPFNIVRYHITALLLEFDWYVEWKIKRDLVK